VQLVDLYLEVSPICHVTSARSDLGFWKMGFDAATRQQWAIR